MAVTGEPDGPPGKCGVSVIDFAGGYAAMVGLMVGLFDAQRHGRRPRRRRLAPRHRGEHAVLLRHLDAQPRLGGRAHAGLGAPDPRARPELPHPRRLDRRLLQQGQVLARPGRGPRRARAGGRPALRAASPPASPTGRRWWPRSRSASRTRTTAEWLDRLRGRVPCAPVNDVRQALADEQVLAREMIVEVDHPEFGRLREVQEPHPHRGRDPRPRAGAEARRAHGCDPLARSSSTAPAPSRACARRE